MSGTQRSSYALHGLTVNSEIALDAMEECNVEGSHDLTVNVGLRRVVTQEVPTGMVLSHLADPTGKNDLSIVRTKDGFAMRYHGLADIVLSAERTSATITLDPDVAEDNLSIIAGGGLAGLVTALTPAPIGEVLSGFHASAVLTRFGVVLFAGDSGAGKSTVAAFACAAGAKVVSDDMVRVVGRHGVVEGFYGTRSLRLRPGAAAIADLFPGAQVRQTSDQRTALRPDAFSDGDSPLTPLPIAAVILPELSELAGSVSVRHIPAKEAVRSLLSLARTPGFSEPSALGRHLACCAHIARTVPVAKAVVPFRPSEARAIGRDVLARARELVERNVRFPEGIAV